MRVGKIMARNLLVKELINTRLANQYGGWIYCDKCNKSIGYLCYVTYDYFFFEYVCNCGSHGSAKLSFVEKISEECSGNLILSKNRYVCEQDQSPLFTVLTKNLKSYQIKVLCNQCGTCSMLKEPII